MPIKIACDCGRLLAVPDRGAGKMTKCPGCGRLLGVPSTDTGRIQAPTVKVPPPGPPTNR
jgi:hypothetical protein